MDLGPLLRAHGYLRVERPPELWAVDADDVLLVRVVGEMLAAALARGNDLGDIVLRANNVTVVGDADDADPRQPPVPGDYVALSVLGAGSWEPEVRWSDRVPVDRVLLNAHLDAAARATRLPFAYTRQTGDTGSITIFLRRASA